MTTDQQAMHKLLNNNTPAYRKGFQHGLEIGVENNQYKTGFNRYAYRYGYEAGVAEYCRVNHAEEEE